jgi:predicted DNA-binding protein
MKKDIRLDIYITPEMYLALKHVCESVDRTMSQHVRHLIRRDIEQSIDQIQQKWGGSEAGTAREVTWGGDE